MSITDPNILLRLNAARTPRAKKVREPMRRVSEEKTEQIKEDKKAGVNADLDAWFAYHMEHAEPICAECGMTAPWLKNPENAAIWKACQAHLLPKKKGAFPSIRGVLENHIVLFPSWGGHYCGCHGFYDSSWFNASTMKIWPHVKEVFRKKLHAAIAKNELSRIPEHLLKDVIL